MNAYFEIAYAAASGRLCLFTGTGFSKAITGNAAPGWQALLEIMCTRLPDPARLRSALFPATGPNPLPLEEAAQIIELEMTREGLSLRNEIAAFISSVTLAGDNTAISAFMPGRPVAHRTLNYNTILGACVWWSV